MTWRDRRVMGRNRQQAPLTFWAEPPISSLNEMSSSLKRGRGRVRDEERTWEDWK